jgi:putative ABC transport system substrate-binding protein
VRSSRSIQRIVTLAESHRLPALYEHRASVEAGGLMSYGPNHGDMFRRLAVYVDKILRGAKPADLPIEQPTKVELVINLKAAKALGLTIPPLAADARGRGHRVMVRSRGQRSRKDVTQ